MTIDTSLILHYITLHYDGLANRGALEFHHIQLERTHLL